MIYENQILSYMINGDGDLYPMVRWPTDRNNQSLKGAVVVNLRQSEADVKCQMDIDSHISLTEQARKISSLIAPASSVGEVLWKFPLELFFCLILAEGRANCSFQYMRQAIWIYFS